MEMTVTEEATAEEIVAWLESPEGEAWSRHTHRLFHSYGMIASIKDDAQQWSGAHVSDPSELEFYIDFWPQITGWTPDDPPENA